MKQGIIYIIAIVSLFLLRSIFFAANYGGIEHDSGWYLGVARNLAQRGIYASYTNTISHEERGVQNSIHGRYSVQDENGFSYFPAGVTAGPGYIIPQALMMKIFGYDFWQFRLWPLLTYAGVLLIIFLIAHKLGGWFALLWLQLWFWFTPQLFIQFSYESYGEHTALFYLLLSFYTYYLSAEIKKKQNIFMIFSGLFFSLAVLTKYLFLLSGTGFAIIAFWQLIRVPDKKKVIKLWGLWFLSLIIPLTSFELYRYLFMLNKFDINSWRATTEDFLLHFRNNGGGLDISKIDWGFVAKKGSFWNVVGVKAGFVWLIFLPLTYYYFKKIRSNTYLGILLFSAFVSTSLWFIFLSPFGWTRHVWHGLIIGMMLLIIVSVNSIKNYTAKILFILLFIAVILGRNILNPSMFAGAFFLGQKNIDTWQMKRYEFGIQGLPPNPMVSLQDQIGLRNFFAEHVRENDKVYYLGWLLVSEASPIVYKVFYSLDRYLDTGQLNPENGKQYLILGPYQKGKLSIVGPEYNNLKVNILCNDIVYENPSYTLCILRNNLIYENKAYE